MTKFVSPKGTAGYPKLTRPDTKFNAEGVYSTSLVMDEKTAKPFVELIEQAYVDEFGPKVVAKANWPYKEEEGQYTFKFKSKQKPKLFDAKGTAIKSADELNVGSGSVMKVQGAISCRAVLGKNYATLYMNAVQIIDLVEYSGSPFDSEEGGFTVEDEPTVDASVANEEKADF